MAALTIFRNPESDEKAGTQEPPKERYEIWIQHPVQNLTCLDGYLEFITSGVKLH